MSSVKLDDLDKRILLALQGDPRASYKALGAALNVTGQTIANRVRRMQSAGIIRLRVQANLEALGLDAAVFGLISCDLADRTAIEEALTSNPAVLFVRRFAGEFDLAFEAAFSKAPVANRFVEALQHLTGVRRLVVYHGVQTLLEQNGWQAVWNAQTTDEADSIDWLQELSVPKRQALRTALAVDWVSAFAHCDVASLKRLSVDDITFQIMPPNPGVGIYGGLPAVVEQARLSYQRYRRVWYTPVAVQETAQLEFDFVIDALSPVELADGSHSSAFSRIGFQFSSNLVSRVALLGVLNLEALGTKGPDDKVPRSAAREGP